MTELKPCPFCGGEAALYEKRFVALKPLYTVECRSCTALVGRDCETYQASKGYTHFYSKDDAIAAWNRRVKDER